MKFIGESIIDACIEHLSAHQITDADMETLAEDQPALMFYLSSEHTEAFSDRERGFLFFAALVVLESIAQEYETLPILKADDFTKIEEENFTIFGEAKGGNFRDRITVFFEGYEQEDLLAFVEDSLEEDEEGIITTEGRDYIFIMMKTVIDVFHQAID